MDFHVLPGQEFLSHLHARLLVAVAAPVREHFVPVSVSPWDPMAPV
jgi:hypothetical protein